MSDQSRASAWILLKWMDTLDISNVLIENVPEFQDWCRLSPTTGLPIRSEKGRLFRQFIESIKAFKQMFGDSPELDPDTEALLRARFATYLREHGHANG